MTETPPILPSSSTSLLSTMMKAMDAVVVLQVPKGVAQIQGVVISSNPALAQMVVQTAEGEIKLQTFSNLPPGTKVEVTITQTPTQQLAKVTILKPAPDAPPPPPPQMQHAQAGQTLPAVKLPPLPNPIAQIAAQIETLKKNDPQKTLSKLPPEIRTAKDIPTALKFMPAKEFEAVKALLLPPAPPKTEAPETPLRQAISAYTHEEAIKPQQLVEKEAPLRITLIKILPPDTPAPKPTSQQIVARAQEPMPSGMPVVETESGEVFVLRAPVKIATGSVLLIEVREAPKQAGLPTALPATLHETETLLNIAQNMDPAAAAAFRATLPSTSAPQQLAPAALLFIALLRNGDVKNWLGENMLRILEASGRQELLPKFSTDFTQMSAHAKDTPAEGWRSLALPLMHDGKMHLIDLYVRRDPEPSAAEADRPATRFLLNLHLSRMGEMQLDGFIRHRAFDMVLRTEEKLPFEMRQEIMKRFASGLEQVNMAGGLSFQAGRSGWVTPPAAHKGITA